MVSSQFPPSIHSPFGVTFARPPISRANSCALVAAFSCTLSNCIPPETKCTCASLNPGRTSFPPASITGVRGPRQASISGADPTATIRSPSTARACAVGNDLSTVQTLPLVMIRSAAGFLGPAHAQARISAHTARRSTLHRELLVIGRFLFAWANAANCTLLRRILASRRPEWRNGPAGKESPCHQRLVGLDCCCLVAFRIA